MHLIERWLSIIITGLDKPITGEMDSHAPRGGTGIHSIVPEKTGKNTNSRQK